MFGSFSLPIILIHSWFKFSCLLLFKSFSSKTRLGVSKLHFFPRKSNRQFSIFRNAPLCFDSDSSEYYGHADTRAWSVRFLKFKNFRYFQVYQHYAPLRISSFLVPSSVFLPPLSPCLSLAARLPPHSSRLIKFTNYALMTVRKVDSF